MYCISFHEVVCYMWDSTVLEKRKTIKCCLIIDRNFATKEHRLGLSGAIFNGNLSLYRICFFLHVLSSFSAFLLYIFVGSLFITTYLRHVSGYIYYIKWDLKPPCQTRKSVGTDF